MKRLTLLVLVLVAAAIAALLHYGHNQPSCGLDPCLNLKTNNTPVDITQAYLLGGIK